MKNNNSFIYFLLLLFLLFLFFLCLSITENGEFLVVLDDESRENEGDLIIAAEKITTEKMAFLVRHSSGYVCAPLTNTIADRLNLPLMATALSKSNNNNNNNNNTNTNINTSNNKTTPEKNSHVINGINQKSTTTTTTTTSSSSDVAVATDADGAPSDRHGTAYTITCDFAEGTTTGISAHDRALTASKLADATTRPNQFLKPGHLLPLRARDGGVLERRGHTEAGVDLCKLSGLQPVSVICEIVREEDGLMARRDDCLAFAKKHNIKAITIDDLVQFIKSTSSA